MLILGGCSGLEPFISQQTAQLTDQTDDSYLGGDGITIDDRAISAVLGDSMDGSEIEDESVTSEDLRESSVRSEEIEDGSVGFDELADGLIGTDTGIVNGSVGSGELQKDSVGAVHIKNDSVGSDELKNDSVGSDELKDDSVGSDELKNDSVGSDELQNDSVGSDELKNDSVGSDELKNDSVGEPELKDGAVTSAKIFNGTIQAIDLAVDSVTSTEIVDGTIAAVDLAADSVTSAKIVNGTIRSVDIAANAITSAKIVDGTIQFADLGSNGCTTDQVPLYDGSDWGCADISGGGPHDHLGEHWQGNPSSPGLFVEHFEGIGIIASGDDVGLLASGSTAIKAVAEDGAAALHAVGDIRVTEKVTAKGTSNVEQNISTTDGPKKAVYTSVVAGQVRTEISGTATLVDGEVEFELPAHFMEMTNTSASLVEDRPFVVQVTPYSNDTNGLVVDHIDYQNGKIKIRDRGGSGNYRFAFTVKGIREGHEDKPVVRDR